MSGTDAGPAPSRGRALLGRRLDVFGALAAAEIRDSRDLTALGIAKWLLEPLSYMFVYFVLVASILNRSRFAFPLFLLSALVPWRYFTGVVQGSMTVFPRFASVIANVPVPRGVLPLVVMAAEAANLLLSLVLFAPMMLIYRVEVWPQVLWVPVIVANLLLLTAGPAYVMAVFGLYHPHFRGVAQNLIRAGFFVSTALIPLREVPGEQLPQLIRANPFSGIFDSFRAVFMLGRNPKAFDLLYPAVVGLLMLGVGALTYARRRDRIPKEV